MSFERPMVQRHFVLLLTIILAALPLFATDLTSYDLTRPYEGTLESAAIKNTDGSLKFSNLNTAVVFDNIESTEYLPVVRLNSLTEFNTQVFESSCTGFVIQSLPGNSVEISKNWLVTASHCLPGHPIKPLPGLVTEVQQAVIDYGSLLQKKESHYIYISKSNNLVFEDVFATPIKQNRLKSTTVLNLADHAPTAGDRLMPVGYPRMRGPQGDMCLYTGYMSVRDPLDDKYRVKPTMFCPNLSGYNSVEGLSGAPVLNVKGEVVGVVSIESSLVDQNGKHSGVLFFTSINKTTFLDDSSYINPILNGRFNLPYMEVNGVELRVNFELTDGLLDGDFEIFENDKKISSHKYYKGNRVNTSETITHTAEDQILPAAESATGIGL